MSTNTTFIRPQWLIHKEPGMDCRPHAETLGMLAMYNVVSAIVSYTLATSFFFAQFRKLQHGSFALLRSSWRRMRRKSKSPSYTGVDSSPSTRPTRSTREEFSPLHYYVHNWVNHYLTIRANVRRSRNLPPSRPSSRPLDPNPAVVHKTPCHMYSVSCPNTLVLYPDELGED